MGGLEIKEFLFEHGGNALYLSSCKKLSEKEILDFSVNLNPYIPINEIQKFLKKEINKIHYYPEIYSQSLIKKIANFFKIPENEIVIGNGSTQLIYLLPAVLKIKNPLIIEPTFSEYEKSLKSYGIKVKRFFLKEKNNFRLDIDLLKKYINKNQIDIVFLCNPSNPIGNSLKWKDICSIISFLKKKHIYLFVDEAFIDFTLEKSLLNIDYKKLIVLRSLTKVFSIPGLRLGFLKSHESLIKKFYKKIEPWSVNSLSQVLGKYLLNNWDELLKDLQKKIEKERSFIVRKLGNIKKIKIFPSVTNFLLVKIKDRDITVSKLENFLQRKNILIRNCSNFKGLNNYFFRIGIQNRKFNKILIDEILDFFEGENK